jgi:general secretion pathway protein N
MKRIPLRWVVLAAALFGLFLVFTLPARHALGWLGGDRLAVQGIEGTTWHGRVQRLAVGQSAIGPVVWQLRPLKLFAGRIEYQLFVQSGSGGGELRAGRRLFGGDFVEDVQFSMPAADLARQLQLRVASLGGDFQADIDRLVVASDWVSELEGQVVWQGALVLEPSRVALGDLQMALSLRETQIVGTLSDQGGPLALSGEVLIGQDRRYRLDARVMARDTADPQLQEALHMLGAPDAEGRYPLQLSGAF